MGTGPSVNVYLALPSPEPQELRTHRGQATFELCTRCWSPYLEGKLEEHLKAVQHRHPPMGADSPEG